MNSRCSDEPAGVVTTTRNVRGTASAEIVSVAVRLVSLSTWTLVTGGWGSVATTSTVVFCGMNFVPVRMTSTFVPGSPLDGLIAASVGAAGLAALFGVATTDGFEGVVTVAARAGERGQRDREELVRHVSAVAQCRCRDRSSTVERIAALLTRDGDWTVSALSALTASRRSIFPMIWRGLSA